MWDTNGDTLVTSADDPPAYVVGQSYCGFSGDGGPAINAQLSLPYEGRIDVHSAGNLYIADRGNVRVREVTPGADGYIDGDPDDIIDTVAGGGGPLGDGGPATSASIAFPADLDRDAAGNLYIADAWNGLIRKVTAGSDGMVAGGADAANEIITTAVGGGSGCVGQENPEGDGCDPTEAHLDYPVGVTLDPDGNIFIADAWHARVRVVNTQAGPITVANVTIPAGKIDTVAGNGVHGFGGDEGPATSASFRGPVDIALDPAGNFYIADYYNHRVRRVDNASGVITTVAGSGLACAGGADNIAATATDLCQPIAVLLDSAGNLLVADEDHLRVRRVDAGADGVVDGDPDEVIITVAGLTAGEEICPEKLNDQGDGCAAHQAKLGAHSVRDIALDSAGNLYISHADPDLVRRVIPGADGIIDRGSDELIHTVVYSMKAAGGYRGDGGMACAAASRWPNGLLIQPDPSQPSLEHMYIADDWSHRIRRAEAPLDPDPDEDGLYTCLGYPSELDLGTDPFDPDTDDDACLDGEEVGLGSSFDPVDGWFDVYDVPVPAKEDAVGDGHGDDLPPVGANGPRNKLVDIGDVLAVLFYAFADEGGPPNANGVDYDSDKGIDTDGDTVADVPPDGVPDGRDYDRSPGLDPDPVTGIDPAGAPNGVIDIGDVLAALAQAFVVDCTGPP